MKYKRKHRLPEEYYKEGLFFITICTNDRLPLLSYFNQHQELILTSFGESVLNTLMVLQKKYEQVTLTNWVLMPDHIHFIIDINIATTKNHLFQILQWLKSKTAKNYNYGIRHFGWEQNTKPVWQYDYYDKIVWCDKQKQSFEYYIENNPSEFIRKQLIMNKTTKY